MAKRVEYLPLGLGPAIKVSFNRRRDGLQATAQRWLSGRNYSLPLGELPDPRGGFEMLSDPSWLSERLWCSHRTKFVALWGNGIAKSALLDLARPHLRVAAPADPPERWALLDAALSEAFDCWGDRELEWRTVRGKSREPRLDNFVREWDLLAERLYFSVRHYYDEARSEI